MIFDIYHDAAHAHLRHLVASHPGVEPLLKEAEFEDDPANLPPTAFAWPTQRRFPVHTPEHAVVSHLYVNANPQTPAFVRLKVAEALEAYGVSKDALARVETKVAETDEDFIFPENHTYPVRSHREVKMAEARLLDQVERLPLPSRVAAFHKLAQAAERHGVTLQPAAQAWGMAALSNPGLVIDGLAARAHLAKTAEARAAYANAANALRAEPTALRSFPARVKLASVLLKLDGANGLDTLYGKKIPDPLHTVFNEPMKVSAHMIDIGGGAYDLQDLTNLPAHFYADTLGQDVVREIAPGGRVTAEKLAEVLPTLPMELKRVLGETLRSAGVRRMSV
jgi:hypothetical protein